MPVLDRVTNFAARLRPFKSSKTMSGGIGHGGHGMVPFDDDMIVSKPAIIFHSSQIFLNFLAMACYASVASFQAKWGVGPSGLSGFALFVSIGGIFLSAFMLLVPVVHEKYDKLNRLARALKEVRVGFILTGVGTSASLLISFIVTISAWTQAGCKNPDNDPNADKGDDFKKGLSGFCSTKKAAAIFFWLAFGFWLASLTLLVLDWRSGKLHAPRDPPFAHPTTDLNDLEEGDEDDEDASYSHIPRPTQTQPASSTTAPHRYDPPNAGNPFADTNRYSGPTSSSSYTPAASSASALPASRPSMDAYGAFSDPAPSGFGAAPAGFGASPAGYGTPPGGFGDASPGRGASAEPDIVPKVSRTMQYADPYAAVRASIAGQPQAPASSALPPSYDTYQGYR